MSHWYFACESDMHFRVDNGVLSWQKGDYMAKYNRLKALYPMDFLLSVGDVTERGNDGTRWWFFGIYHDSKNDEFQKYLDNYVAPIERLGIPVKVCPGNHDVHKWDYPGVTILKYIRDRYGGNYSWFKDDESANYAFNHKGFRIISTGIYPKNLNNLKALLPVDKTVPVILFNHYNVDVVGEDWWPSSEIEAFYNTIKSYNIKLIVNGHSHETKTGIWRNIPYVLCYQPTIVEINGTNVSVRLNP